MIVTVKPKRPIPGILPKNKWIDVEMELDLNESEIRRCMQHGVVYYNNEPIDDLKLTSLFNPKKIKLVSVEITSESKIEEDKITNLSPVFVVETVKPEPIIEEPVIEEYTEEVVIEELVEEPVVITEVINTIKEVSCVREDNYVILELEFNTNTDKLENVIGTFKVNSGSKIEYKSDNDKWVKFNYNFNTFKELKDGTKLVFRFSPNHKSLLKYHLVLSEENNGNYDIVLDGSIDQSNL